MVHKIKKSVPHICQVAPVTNIVTGITYNSLAINEADRVQLEWNTLCQCIKCRRIVVTPVIKQEEKLVVPGVKEVNENN